MDFPTAIKTCLVEKYATFEGRASRSEFWFFILFLSIISIIMDAALASFPNIFMVSLYVIKSLALFLPNIAVVARRLHDGDNSGWWQIIPIIPAFFVFFFLVVGVGGSVFGIFAVIGGISTVILGIALLVFLIQKGTEGENRFGPPVVTDDWEQRRDEYNKEKQHKLKESDKDKSHEAEDAKEIFSK